MSAACRSMVFHRCAARWTSHNSRKRGRYPLFRYLTRTRRRFEFFYLIPQFAAYNRLVIIRNNDLLFLRNFYDLLIFVRNMLHSLLNQISDVKLLRQYTSDGRGWPKIMPLARNLFPELALGIHGRRWNPVRLQIQSNPIRAFAFGSPFENPPYHLRRFFVYNRRMIFIVFSHVTVRRFRSKIFPCLRTRIFYRTDFFARIRRMPFVKNVHNRHHIHCRRIFARSVDSVLYRDKSYSERRKHIIDILSDKNIISAETRQIFYYNRIDFSCFCVVKQPLYSGAIEIRSRIAVVDIYVFYLPAFFFYVFRYEYFLILDRKRFSCALVVAA